MSDLQTEIELLRGRAPWMMELPKDPAEAGLIQVELSDDDWKERAEAIAAMERERAEVIAEKTTTATRYTAKIKVLDQGIARLAEEIETKTKWRDPQESLPMKLDAAKKSRRSMQRGTQDAAEPVEP